MRASLVFPLPSTLDVGQYDISRWTTSTLAAPLQLRTAYTKWDDRMIVI